MSTPSTPVHLIHIGSGQTVPAELVHSIGEQQLLDWENHWKPARTSAIQNCCATGNKDAIPDSWHWEWPNKVKGMRGVLATAGLSIVCNGVTQGLLKINKTGSARIESQRGKPVIYIDYLETAPWNIKDFIPPGLYAGVGSILLGAAIQISLEEGFKGRIGLHSVPKAEEFYRKAKMVDLGRDSKYSNMHYFEMTPSLAMDFLA